MANYFKKVRFRVIVLKDDASDSNPYRVQRKSGFFSLWKNVSYCRYVTVEEAEKEIRREMKKPRPGVIKYYNEADDIVDTLKGI